MYYILNWFIPSIFLLSTQFPSDDDFNRFKNSKPRAGGSYLLATHEAEIRRILV
jgi:hypothetical protein